MKTLELRKASKPLADYAAELGSESLVLTSNREPIAALVSLRGMDRESLALSLSPELGKIIRRARREAREGKVFSLKRVKEELLGQSAPVDKAIQAPLSGARSRRVPSARKKRSPRHARSPKLH